MKRFLTATALALGLQSAGAATFVISVQDGADEGFNDPTAVSPIGGNNGTTLGQQRLNVFQAAADRWGQFLESDVTIVVSAQFDQLACGANSAVLGSAGPTASDANFSGGEPNVAYHIALANALSGTDRNGASPEINATFNSDIDDDPACLGGVGWYYGLQEPPPGTDARPLYPVVLHELGHGLGFIPLANLSNGTFTGAGGFPDAFSRLLFDVDDGLFWDQMSNPQRAASATDDPNLTWGGVTVDADGHDFLGPAPDLIINAPAGIAGSFEGVIGEEPNANVPMGGVTADIVDGNDFSDGCSSFNEGGAFNGNIAIFDLPASCSAVVPAFFAENRGAVGVLIAATTTSGFPDMTGQIGNQDITIPYVGIEKAVADDLRANLAMASVTLQNSTSRLNGDTMEMLRMHAPATLSESSSVGHFTPLAKPDLLMEPSLGNVGFNQVDLTISAFEDMGWPVAAGGADDLIFSNGFEQ